MTNDDDLRTALTKLKTAMLGTTDGDLIDPDSEIPAGEMYRLAAEALPSILADALLAAHPAPETVAEMLAREATDAETMPVAEGPYVRNRPTTGRTQPMTDARAWCDQVDARTNAATDGPWSRSATELDLPGFNMSPSTCAGCGEDWPLEDADAEFIAHARTDLPAMSAALRAVLDLHRRIPYGSPALCASAPWVPPFVCEHCLAESDGCVPYPCPTVTAVTTALEDA